MLTFQFQIYIKLALAFNIYVVCWEIALAIYVNQQLVISCLYFTNYNKFLILAKEFETIVSH